MDKSCCLIHLSGVMAPKLKFCPYLVLWWPWPLTYDTQNLISFLSHHTSTKFQWNPFMHSGVFALTRLRETDGQTDRRRNNPKHNASDPLKWGKAYIDSDRKFGKQCQNTSCWNENSKWSDVLLSMVDRQLQLPSCTFFFGGGGGRG